MILLMLISMLSPIHLIANGADTRAAQVVKAQYRCPMHPTVLSDHSGECPICHMRLEKVRVPNEGRRIKCLGLADNADVRIFLEVKSEGGSQVED